MARTLALAVTLLALAAGDAHAASFEVVIVPALELSDLPRLEEEGAVGILVPGAGPETSEELARAALARGEVRNSLRGGPPSGPQLVRARTGPFGSAEGPAIYLALPQGGRQANDRRYPVVVVGHGFEGVLTSDSTRIPGVVSIADVAPTALGREDGLGHAEQAGGAEGLLELDRRIDQNNNNRRVALVLVCALLLAALLLPFAAAIGIAVVLAANLALGLAGVSAPWAVLLVLGLAVAVGGPLLALARPGPLALGLGLAAVVGAYLLVLGLDGPSVALSPLGPTQNSRFFGLSNLLETLLLLPAFAGAALVGRRFGWPGFGVVAALALLAVAGNRFGADGGGAIVLAAGFAVLAVLLAGAGRRALAATVALALALVLALLALDAATGGSSHVTRALEEGPGGLADELRDRVLLSYERATETWWSAAGLAALLGAGGLFTARTLLRKGAGPATAVPLALAAALGISLVVNDSPVDVLLVGWTAYLAADLGMLPTRWPGPSRSCLPSPPLRSPSLPPAAEAATRSRPSRRP